MNTKENLEKQIVEADKQIEDINTEHVKRIASIDANHQKIVDHQTEMTNAVKNSIISQKDARLTAIVDLKTQLNTELAAL